jgi:DeoR family transcriptional regulator of aga operon
VSEKRRIAEAAAARIGHARSGVAQVGRARRVIVVCDSSKIGRAALSVICGAGDGDVLITDSGAPAEMWSR